MALFCSSMTGPPRDVPLRGWRGAACALAAALAAAMAALVAAAWMLPPPLVMPVFAAAVILTAATMGLIAWASPRGAGIATTFYWDVTGALTAIGLCAAMLGEPEPMVALMEREATN